MCEAAVCVCVCVQSFLSSPCFSALLHISLGTSKVSGRYFQPLGLSWCFLLLRSVFISPFVEPFCSQTLPTCPRPESSSVLKRPSDSNSALSSVTPRDRLVDASGAVRSTASNNAPYMDGVRRRESDTRKHHMHTHPDTRRYIDAFDTAQRDTQLGGNAHTHQFTLPSSQISAPTHTHTHNTHLL